MNIFSFIYDPDLKNINKKNFKKKFDIKLKDLKYHYKIFFEKNKITIVLGRPIIGEKINFVETKNYIEDSNLNQQINGEFLIIQIDLKLNKLIVINDRFGSIPFYYYYYKGKFYGSISYVDILKKLSANKILKINEYKVYEFLRYQRIFNDKNYDTKSYALMAYNKLEFKNKKITCKKYWKPKFKKGNESIGWYAKKLNYLIDQSIRRKFSGKEKKLIFFLSGGIDSRSFLTKIYKLIKTESATVAPKFNNEAKVAKEVSDTLGIKNNFFSLGVNPYKNKINEMSILTNGTSSFDHSIFLNIKKSFFNKFDLSSSGWGIDIYFQGYYIPLIRKKIFNIFPTFFFKIDQNIYSQNLTSFFMKNLPYRNKEYNLFNLLKLKKQILLKKKLRNNISKIYKEAKKISNNPVDIYNHMCVDNMFRHYSITNVLSMNYCKKNTCIMFDNDLLEFYYTIPSDYLLNKKLYREYVKKYVNKKIISIRTGNENVPFILSSIKKTLIWYLDKILVKLRLRNQTLFYNPLSERTWPARQNVIKEKSFTPYLKKLEKSKFLANLKILNKKKFYEFLEKVNDNPNWYKASTIIYLISLNEIFEPFLKDKK